MSDLILKARVLARRASILRSLIEDEAPDRIVFWAQKNLRLCLPADFQPFRRGSIPRNIAWRFADSIAVGAYAIEHDESGTLTVLRKRHVDLLKILKNMQRIKRGDRLDNFKPHNSLDPLNQVIPACPPLNEVKHRCPCRLSPEKR